MTETPPIRFDPYDVGTRLAELGLTRDIFVKAAREGWNAYITCSPNHPPTFPGTAAWAETIRSIRDSLAATDWTRANPANLPLVLNADKTMAITVSSGDAETGRVGGFPKTRSAKGPQTAAAVKTNGQAQFAFMEDPAPIAESLKVKGRSTWLFLMFRDIQKNELRYELSLPISMGDDGFVDEWAERILFPPDPIDPRNVILDRGDDDRSPDITVQITRVG
jgi:hypothetical protein